jgi:hypothetical protein
MRERGVNRKFVKNFIIMFGFADIPFGESVLSVKEATAVKLSCSRASV